MQVLFQSRHTHVSEAVRTAAAEKLARLERYLHRIERAVVTFAEEPTAIASDRETCEVWLHVRGRPLFAKATAAHQGAALEKVVVKLEQQLATRKGRLVGRSHLARKAS